MKLPVRRRIALSGALWFVFVACVCLPLLMSLIPKPLRLSGPLEAANMFLAALYIFGLPTGLVGFFLAKPMVDGTQGVRVFSLGVFLVVLVNLLAGVCFAIYGKNFLSLGSFFEHAATGIAIFFFLDILAFYGAPFLLGGLAALAFRAGIERYGLNQDE
jgi:hypothetical protein